MRRRKKVAERERIKSGLARKVADYFRNRYGIAYDVHDWEHLVDNRLTYRENVRNLERKLLLRKDPELRDFYERTIYEAEQYFQATNPRGWAQDEKIRAKKTFKRGDLRGYELWLRNPNRYDIEGIDAPPRKVKPRKVRKRKRK